MWKWISRCLIFFTTLHREISKSFILSCFSINNRLIPFSHTFQERIECVKNIFHLIFLPNLPSSLQLLCFLLFSVLYFIIPHKFFVRPQKGNEAGHFSIFISKSSTHLGFVLNSELELILCLCEVSWCY